MLRARELLPRALCRALRHVVMQLIECLPCIGQVLRLASAFLPQRLTRLFDRLIHRLPIATSSRTARPIERIGRLRRLRTNRRRRVIEPAPHVFTRHAVGFVGRMQPREILIEPLHRKGEVLTAITTTRVLGRVGGLFAPLRPLLRPAVLLLRELERIALCLLRLCLKLRRLRGTGRILDRLAPALERVLRLFPRFAQFFGCVGGRLTAHARRRLTDRVVGLRVAGFVFALERSSHGALDRFCRATERFRAALLRRLSRALELVLETVDLRIESSLGIVGHRAPECLGLFGDLISAPRLVFFAHRLANGRADRRPRHGERNDERCAHGQHTEPLRRAQERPRDLGLRDQPVEHARGLTHLQALQRRGLLLARELHGAREAILAVDEAIEDARRIELAQPAATHLDDRR